MRVSGEEGFMIEPSRVILGVGVYLIIVFAILWLNHSAHKE